MLRFTRSVCLATALLAMPALFSACSSKPQHIAEPKETMPTEYPRAADEVLARLADTLPLDSEMLAFASYGSLADAIQMFSTYKVVDAGELQKLLTDLGTHYHLDPGNLKSYFNAGMHTGSGFAAGRAKGSVFIVFDILSEKKFDAWWDTFINEEFGRPRYHQEKDGDQALTSIRILKKDFATLAHKNGKVLIVFGDEAFPGSPDSLEAIKTFMNAPKLAGSDALKTASARLSHAPIALLGGSALLDAVPQLADLKSWCTAAGIELAFEKTGPELRAFAGLSKETFKGTTRAAFLSDLTRGATGSQASRILGTAPTSIARILYDPKKLEALLLPMMPEKSQRQYADIKDKLTQRLFKLDIEDQVIYNSGSAWAALYGATLPKQQNPSPADMIKAQKLAVFLPMKDVAKADAFFGKVNILKRFIPENLATIDPQSDRLHAIVNIQKAKIHVAYDAGLIAVATDDIWPTVSKIYDAPAPQTNSPLLQDGHLFAGTFKTSDIAQLLGARFAIVKEQIETFLTPFDSFTVTSSIQNDLIELRATALTH